MFAGRKRVTLQVNPRDADSLHNAIVTLEQLCREYADIAWEGDERAAFLEEATNSLEEAVGRAWLATQVEDDDGQTERDAYDERRVDERLDEWARQRETA